MEYLEEIYQAGEILGTGIAVIAISLAAYDRMREKLSPEVDSLEEYSEKRERIQELDPFSNMEDVYLTHYLEREMPGYDISDEGNPATVEDAEKSQKFMYKEPGRAAMFHSALEEAESRDLLEEL